MKIGPDGERLLTFGSYNFEGGGIDDGKDFRLYRQLDLLAEAGADVWAFQECKGWTALGFAALHAAEQVLGMRGFLARSGHDGCDLAVFIRESAGIGVDAVQHVEGPPYWHAVARVHVVIDDLAYSMVSVHLAPSSPTLRLVEAETFALVARGGRTVIAGGDWNAMPVADPDPPSGNVPAMVVRRKLDKKAAQAIEEAGMTDAAAHLGNADPTVGHEGGLPYRCDRIYTGLPAESVTGYRVIHEDDPLSDHRPVVATFAMPEGPQ